MKRVDLPRYVSELNIAGSIVRCQRDSDDKPFVVVRDEDAQFVLPSLEGPAMPAELTEEADSDESAVVGGPQAPAAGSADLRTHALNVTDSVVMIADIHDAGVLEKLRAGELIHPEWAGGRRGVLNAIGDRLIQVSKTR